MVAWFLEYWKLLALIINGVFILVVWAMSKTFAKKDAVNESIVSLDKRIDLLDVAVENLPDKDLTHKLELRIEQLSGDIKRIEPGLISVKNLSDMLLENELKGKG
ncbi:hypothetical protein A9Q81_20785 [Gammaproteobacteria bacterium 42_54_T18]|nr:hypothetical protein A9Q81_20785 [Gammaproteobacteria bacterium 42_54_T18]